MLDVNECNWFVLPNQLNNLGVCITYLYELSVEFNFWRVGSMYLCWLLIFTTFFDWSSFFFFFFFFFLCFKDSNNSSCYSCLPLCLLCSLSSSMMLDFVYVYVLDLWILCWTLKNVHNGLTLFAIVFGCFVSYFC